MCVDWSKVKRVMRRGVEILKLFRNGEQLYPVEQEDVVEIVWENANAGSIGGLSTFDKKGETQSVSNTRSASVDCYEVVNGVRTKVTPTLVYSWASSNSGAFGVSNTNSSTATVTCNINDADDGSATITRYVQFSYGDSTKVVSCTTTAYKEAYEEPVVPEVSISSIELTVNAGRIGNLYFEAGGDDKTVPNDAAATCSVLIKFSDGTSSTSHSKYGSLSAPTYTYSLSRTNNGFSVSGSTVSAANRKKVAGAERSVQIIRTASFTFTPNEGSAVTKTGSCSSTATQGENYKHEVSSYISSLDSATLVNSSGDSVSEISEDSGTLYLQVVGTAQTDYEWDSGEEESSSGSTVIQSVDGISSSNSNMMYAARYGNSYSYNNAVGGFEVTVNTNSSTSSRSGSLTAMVGTKRATSQSVSQSGIVVIDFGLTISNASLDGRTISFTLGYNSVTVGKGVSYSVTNYHKDGSSTFITSGSASITSGTSRNFSKTISTPQIADGDDFVVEVWVDGYPYSATSASLSYEVEEEATISSIELLVNGGSINNISFGAEGGSKSISGSGASCTVRITYSDGSVSTSYSGIGTLSGPTYTYDVSSPFSVSGSSVSASSKNGDTKSSSGTVTRTAKYTFKYDGNTITETDNATASVSQEGDSVKETVYEISDVSLSYGDLGSTEGSSESPMYSYSIYKKTVYNSGYETAKSNVTNSVTPTISFSKSGSGFSIDSSSGVVTASGDNNTSSDKTLGTARISVSYGGASGSDSASIVQSKSSASISNISAGWVQLPPDEMGMALYNLVIYNGNSEAVSVSYEIEWMGGDASGSAYIQANGAYYTDVQAPRSRPLTSESYSFN